MGCAADGRRRRDARIERARRVCDSLILSLIAVPFFGDAEYIRPAPCGHEGCRGILSRMTTTTTATIRAAAEADLPAISAIYNREVTDGVATWDTVPWTDEQRLEWFNQHRMAGAAALVAEVDGAVVGFADLSFYKTRGGYRFTREDTVYVAPDHQRQGIGRALLEALLVEARSYMVHAVIARIEATNEASIELHRALGFEVTGEEREAGYKFGEWRTLTQMQTMLATFNDEVC